MDKTLVEGSPSTFYQYLLSTINMSKRKHQKFLSLYQPVHNRFERFCRARAFGDMPYEDLMNETLLVAYKKLEEIKNEGAFLSFLIGISTRLLANARRKKKAQTVEDDFVLNNFADPHDEMDRKWNVEMLHQGLARLPEQQREAIILFEITGFSIKEIMAIQNSGESAVKQRLARGRKELAKIIKNELSVEKTK